jgi:NADH-quinone oxidoreductase subunit F
MAITFRELIERTGGIRGGWDNLLAVIPAAHRCRWSCGEIMDAPMDFDGLKAVGSGLGTAAVIVMDKSTGRRPRDRRLSYFFKHESRSVHAVPRGTGWMWRVMERMRTGDADVSEIDTLLEVTKQVEGHTICALGDAAAWPIQGLIRHFRPEMERRIANAKATTGNAPMMEAAE